MNIVITGANRGIGLALTKLYLDRGDSVWACYRNDLGGLSAITSDRLVQLQWDISQTVSTNTLQQIPDRVDLLFNNAGIYGPYDGQTLETITAEDMLQVFDVDCVGALRVVQSLQDKIISAQGIIANISSKMGSSDDNTSGGCYAYRAAKAAMIIVSKSMAVDLGKLGVRVITLHPGWVQTDMTHHSGEIDADTSANGLATVIDTIDQYSPGAFIAWDGERIPY
ncbi:MAG: SDR family oxidoreductase [Gammaproteobacteria bacterium]